MRDTFIALDAEAILNIPVRRGGGEDFLASAYETSGTYSVKSAYRALVNQKERLALDEGQITGTSVDQQHVWNAIWKLKVVPKVKVFWWRVMRGLLPDECTLKRRHMKQISTCKGCLAREEDLEHALMLCSHARRFWEETRLLFDINLPRLHPHTWRKDILCDQRFSEKERAILVTVMWAIWMSRNRLSNDKEGWDHASSVRKIREDLAILDIPGQLTSPLPGYGWQPPDNPYMKINTDAAVHLDGGNAGLGGVARSSSGFKGAWRKPFPGVTDPLIAEALALKEGAIFATL